MPRLSHAQEQARQQIAGLATSGLSANQLGERLLAAIQLAIWCDGAQLYAVDPTTLLFNRQLAVTPEMQSHTHWYLRHRYLQEPVADVTHPALMRANLMAVALHDRLEISWGLPKHLARSLSKTAYYEKYHEFTGASGILRAFFPAYGQWIGALDLARFNPGDPFRPTDVAFLHLIAPLIGQVLCTGLARERAVSQADTADLSACGVLMLAPHGDIQTATPAARGWLDVLLNADMSRERHLPTVIWSAIASLRASGRPAPPANVRVLTPRGSLRVEASPVDEAGTVAIVLVPQQQQAVPAIPARWGLTSQERQVTEQAVRGLSNRQIAASLVITEHTVETHLRHVYEKLDIHSRSQLLALYFAEVHHPNLF